MFFVAIITVFALAFNVIGYDHNLDSASWCWIDPTTPNAVVWQLFTGKVWEITCYVITCVLYFTTVFYIKKRVIVFMIYFKIRFTPFKNSFE